MRKIISTFFFAIGLVLLSKAQFFNYTKDNAVILTGTYDDLAGNGTKITTNYLGQPMGTVNDNSSIQNIGFTFNFSGTNFTQFVLNTNGFIKLGTDTVSASQAVNVLSTTATGATNVIYPCNINLQPTGNTEYRVYTSGTAGSQVCTIQFKAVTDSGCPACGPTDRQFDNMEFQIKLYEATNVIEFVYGSFTASVNPSNFFQPNCGLKSVDAAHSVNATKASSTAFLSTLFIDGNYPGNHFNMRNSVLPSPGFTLQFNPIPILTNNVQLQTNYVVGKVPKLYDNLFSVYIQNIGATSYTNYPVTLNVTGANAKQFIVTLPTLNSGEKQLVTFPTFNWANLGTNKLALSLPSDDDNGDNIDTATQVVTNLTIGTCADTTIQGNLGQTTSSIDMAVRFKNVGANKIVSVNPYFSSAGKTYRLYIYGVDTDTPKTKLFNMTTNLTSVAGKNTYTFATPVTVTGDFFVVITQLSTTTSVGLGFQSESPIRSKTFYGRTPQGSSVAPTTGWFDFAPNNSFRLMMDANMQTATWPIVLTSFEGFKDGKNNVLNWQTSSEINSVGFEIQRSTNGKDFIKIGFVNSRGASNTIVNYSYVDTKPNSGTNYYRLRQLDKDGKETFSEIVTIKSDDKVKLEVVSLYPNPSKDNATLVFNSAIAGKTNVTITNLSGKVVFSQVLSSNKGENKIQLNTAQLSAGNYLINVAEMDTENSVTTKYIKL